MNESRLGFVVILNLVDKQHWEALLNPRRDVWITVDEITCPHEDFLISMKPVQAAHFCESTELLRGRRVWVSKLRITVVLYNVKIWCVHVPARHHLDLWIRLPGGDKVT